MCSAIRVKIMLSRFDHWLSRYVQGLTRLEQWISRIEKKCLSWVGQRLAPIDKRISRIEDDQPLMHVIRRGLLIVDILSLLSSIVLYNCGVIDKAPAGAFTILSIMSILLFVQDKSFRMQARRTVGGQIQVNRFLGREQAIALPAARKPLRRTKPKDRKPPWEL